MKLSERRHLSSVTSPLGIIAGAGRLPLQLVEACQATGRDVFVLGFDDVTNPATIAHVPHAMVPIGHIGRAIAHFRKAGVKELVMAGRVPRPTMADLKLDKAAAKLLTQLGKTFFAGDDALLKAVIAFLEQEGFTIIGAQDVLSNLVATEGAFGTVQPNADQKADIIYGMEVAKRLGELDVGQAVVVEGGYVLGVEAAEGTDALLSRVKKLKQTEHGGVLVKVKKPLQETRVDLPAIGPVTVVNTHAAGLAGIAIEASGSLILDKDEVIAKANELGIFVVGINHGG